MQINPINLEIKSYLKQEKIDVALTLYKKYDKGAKNAVLYKDIAIIVRLLDYNPTDRELKEMYELLDPTATGTITKDGLLTILARKARDSDTMEELLAAFRVFDTNNSGKIEEKFLRYVLCKMGSGLTDEEMDLLLKEATLNEMVEDVDDTKYLKYLEFSEMLKPPKYDPTKPVDGKPGKPGKPPAKGGIGGK